MALKAQKILAEKGIFVTVVDLYSVKPIDAETLQKLVKKIPHVIVAEDHYECGGMGEAVLSALSKSQVSITKKQTIANNQITNKSKRLGIENWNLFGNWNLELGTFTFTHLCVRKLPRSGTPHELLHFEHLDEMSMVKAILKAQ